mmetsp:Transcript_10037/g.27252  ORF Transcript_10037/g.27252 Transcript_10037/m.27252 type:complete len:201 (-) Transcript_10037:4847-5449(-)
MIKLHTVHIGLHVVFGAESQAVIVVVPPIDGVLEVVDEGDSVRVAIGIALRVAPEPRMDVAYDISLLPLQLEDSVYSLSQVAGTRPILANPLAHLCNLSNDTLPAAAHTNGWHKGRYEGERCRALVSTADGNGLNFERWGMCNRPCVVCGSLTFWRSITCSVSRVRFSSLLLSRLESLSAFFTCDPGFPPFFWTRARMTS